MRYRSAMSVPGRNRPWAASEEIPIAPAADPGVRRPEPPLFGRAGSLARRGPGVAGRGAVPVAVSEKSRLAPQDGQNRCASRMGSAQAGHRSVALMAVLPEPTANGVGDHDVCAGSAFVR
ncbi:MAG: hypothetical protein DMF79_10655 [Acidobacteria bacterium]|nr:MAG: hypothetical protein DMF79_10655 [Acidobacteriota bacterium]